MGDTFTNPYPAEYGYYRIGTPINADLNRAAPSCPAFLMGALQAENCLLTDVNPTMSKRIQGGGTDAKSQDAMGFSADTSLKLSFFVNAALSAHVSRSRNHCFSNSALTITAYAKQESGITLRRNVPPDVLLKCGTDDFRSKVLSIRGAIEAYAAAPRDNAKRDALIKAYKAFYSTYGTGFISKLSLGAIGMFRGTAKYDSDSDETKANYGGGVSISGIHGGFTAAAEYASKKLKTHANGTFEAEAFGMPAGSSIASWAAGFLDQFAGQQLSKLAEGKAWQESFDAPVAKAADPVIKERPPKATVPSFSSGDIDKQLADIKLNEYVDAWRAKHGGEEPSAAQYEDWIGKLKAVAADVDVSKVAQAKADLKPSQNAPAAPADNPKPAPQPGDAAKAVIKPPSIAEAIKGQSHVASFMSEDERQQAMLRRERRSTMTQPGTILLIGAGHTPTGQSGTATDTALPAITASDIDVHPGYSESAAYASDPHNGADTVDFGGYGVVGYEYTAWGDAFPELRPVAGAPTTSQLSMGVAMAWLSVRETLAQYLRFCARNFPDVAPVGISAASNAFRLAVTDIGDFIVQSFVRSDAQVLTLPALEQEFRQRLASHRFTMLAHYEILLANFTWLRKVPFGAVPFLDVNGAFFFQPYVTTVVNDKVVYECSWMPKTQFPAATFLERGALRLYPIIFQSRKNEIGLHWTNLEFVTLGQRELQIPASIMPRSPTEGPPASLEWGLFRLGPVGFTPWIEKSVPDWSKVADPDKAVWSTAGTGAAQCVLWQPAPNVPKLGLDISGAPGAPNLIGNTYRLSTHSAALPGMATVKLILSAGAAPQYGLDISLAPVDYADAQIAEEPAGGFVGGGAMWIEPKTDRILDALHQLAT